MRVIERFKNWSVEQGQTVDLLELGTVYNARLVKKDKEVYLCGDWLFIPTYVKELFGVPLIEHEKAMEELGEIDSLEKLKEYARKVDIYELIDWEAVEEHNGRIWTYPACARLIRITDDFYDVGEWICDGRECYM